MEYPRYCVDKNYVVHVCMPPRGICVANKELYPGIKEVLSPDVGSCYMRMPKQIRDRYGIVCKATSFVLSGVVGELMVVDFAYLTSNFVFAGDSSAVTSTALRQRINKNGWIDWVALQHKGTKYRYQVEFNAGKFYVRDMRGAVKVYTLLQFREMYDNHGWSSLLPKTSISVALPDLFKYAKKSVGYVEQLLSYAKETAIKQLPFNYKSYGDVIVACPTVIKAYLKSNKCDRFEVELPAYGQIRGKAYNVVNGHKSFVYAFVVSEKELRNRFRLYLGLMGYVESGVESHFDYVTIPNKADYDGIERYTVSSSGVNAYLRKIEDKSALEQRFSLEVIHSCDKYLSHVQVKDSIRVYRGMGFDPKYMRVATPEELPGHMILNDGYTSTTVNLHSAMYFAARSNIGIVLVLRLPVGMHADYIHSVAGWEEQFEVLVDRCYDIRVDGLIIKLRGSGDKVYYIFSADFVQRAEGHGIQKVSSKGEVCYCDYVSDGRLDLTHDYNTCLLGIAVERLQKLNPKYKMSYDRKCSDGSNYTRGTMEVVRSLRSRGFTNVQLQGFMTFNKNQKQDMVVLRRLDKDNRCTDYAFMLVGKVLEVWKLSLNDAVTSRNYWSDKARQESVDRNYSKEIYHLEDSEYEMDIVQTYDLTNEPNVVQAIVDNVMNYIKLDEDIVLYPLQDVARYFYKTFLETVLQEGYYIELNGSIDRVGDVDNENTGYVPVAYKLECDNDMELTIFMRMERISGSGLQLKYWGRAAGKKVGEEESFSWEVCSGRQAHSACLGILYKFVDKLDLSNTRRIEALVNYTKSRMRLIVVASDIGEDRQEARYRLALSFNPGIYWDLRFELRLRELKITCLRCTGTSESYLENSSFNMLYLYKSLKLCMLRGV